MFVCSHLFVWVFPCCFVHPQVLVMKTPTLCTQTTTTTCLVQTTSRSSLIGRHISKHWCHSCATRVILLLFCVSHIFDSNVFFSLQAFLLTSSCCLSAEVNAAKEKQERGGGGREYCSVRQSSSLLSVLRRRSCSKPSFTSVIIKWGSLWFSASNSLRWHQAHTTARRVNRSHFASVRHRSLLHFLEHKWIAKHVALTVCRLVREWVHSKQT